LRQLTVTAGRTEGMGWRAKMAQWELIAKPLARQMRREPTRAEAMLWTRVRGGQLRGMRFRRQHAIGRYIVDFYCARARLVVELDGSSHAGQADLDAQRDQFLLAHGERVLRLANEQVLHDIEGALARIAAMLPIG
jgi:very-short-patch-repair endonuclease